MSSNKLRASDRIMSMEEFFDKIVSIITCDGRNIIGTLKGLDQQTNVVLQESHERVYAIDKPVKNAVLGLYIIRGGNIAIIGLVDEEIDQQLKFDQLRGEQCKPVVHS